MKKFILAALVLILINGCAHSGTKFTEEDVAQFKPKETTRAQIIERIGRPISTFIDADGHTSAMWSYTYVGAFGIGMEVRQLAVTFDDQDRILKMVSSGGPISSGFGK